jgi:hypothetical protein
MAELIKAFLEFQAQIKLYHWQTKSYPRHIASDKLHTDMSALVDRFVEVMVGRYERPKGGATFKIEELSKKGATQYLMGWRNFLQNDFPVAPTDTELMNLRDEMLAAINQTLYLFSLN